MTDEQIDHICQPDLDRINKLGTTKQGMLQVLGAEDETRIKTGYQHCLHDYPPLLRDAYARDTIKDVKKAWTLNAKSGVLNLKNKRLYAIPDMYAACERWFLGIEQPEGILPNGVIWTNEKTYKRGQKLDLLRSPHLYMEHALREMADGTLADICSEWLTTRGVYTSVHDLITRILQFDVDGDMINMLDDDDIYAAAEATIKQYDIVPLYYEGLKAKPEQLCPEAFAHGLKRAHDFSGIGEISNSLTKLWNKDSTPDIVAASWICAKNNYVIDARVERLVALV